MEKIALKNINNPYRELKLIIEAFLGFEIKEVSIKDKTLIIGVFFNIEKELIRTRKSILINKVNYALELDISRILIR